MSMEIWPSAGAQGEELDTNQVKAAELDAYRADMARRGFCLDELTINPESLGFDGYLELAYEMGATAYREPAKYEAVRPRRQGEAQQREIEPPSTDALRRAWVNSTKPLV
jgi:hypothetical protein